MVRLPPETHHALAIQVAEEEGESEPSGEGAPRQ